MFIITGQYTEVQGIIIKIHVIHVLTCVNMYIMYLVLLYMGIKELLNQSIKTYMYIERRCNAITQYTKNIPFLLVCQFHAYVQTKGLFGSTACRTTIWGGK